jgi:hypothetical protein
MLCSIIWQVLQVQYSLTFPYSIQHWSVPVVFKCHDIKLRELLIVNVEVCRILGGSYASPVNGLRGF